jgi:hypothetical protein
MSAAATDLATIGSNVDAAHLVAAAPTTAIVPAAADEVSTGIAALFSAQAQQFQGLAGKAAAFHDQFVQTLKTSAGSYSATEAAAAASLQPAAASLAPAAGPLNLVSQLLADPELIPAFLFVFGFIGYAVIVILVLNFLQNLGVLDFLQNLGV